MAGKVRAVQNFDSRLAALWRGARRDVWSGALPVLSIPPSRWPLRWHVTAALAIALLVAFAGYQWRALQITTLRHAEFALQQAELDLTRVRQQPRVAQSESRPLLARPQSVDQVIRDMGQFAETTKVRLASVKIEDGQESTAAAQQVRFITKAYGDYSGLKTWLAELLARYPALAVSSASIRSIGPDNRQLDASVAFVLYVGPAK